MPVYERGYAHWDHSGLRASPPWWVIARRGITAPLRKRGVLLLLILAWVPAVVKGTMIFIKMQTGNLLDLLGGGGGYFSIEPAGFLTFIEHPVQRFFVFLFMTIVGARLIATDRRDNGLSLYFSRPLGKTDYLLGKVLIVLFYYLAVTLFPVYALCLFSYLISPGTTGMTMLVNAPAAATLYCLASGVSMSLVLLAFSSLGKRTIFIIVWWTILFLGTETVGVIAQATNKDWLQVIGFVAQYHNAGSMLFGADPRLDISPWLSLGLVLAYSALAWALLRDRIRPVEVVS